MTKKKKLPIVPLLIITGIVGIISTSNSGLENAKSNTHNSPPAMPETLTQSTAQALVTEYISSWPYYVNLHAESMTTHVSAYDHFHAESKKFCVLDYSKDYFELSKTPCFVTKLSTAQAERILRPMKEDGIVINYGKVNNWYVFQMQSSGRKRNFETTKNNVLYGDFPNTGYDSKIDKITKLTDKRYEVQFMTWQTSSNPFYHSMLFKEPSTHNIKVEWDGKRFSVVQI